MSDEKVFIEGIGWVRLEDVPAALVVAGVNIEGIDEAPIVDESGTPKEPR